MGYYATGEGGITLTKWDTKIHDDLLDVFEVSYATQEKNGTWHASIWFDYKYHEESVQKTLEAINEITVDGEISFTGEDNAMWHYRYDKDTKKWDEESGLVVYDSSFTKAAKKIVETLNLKEMAEAYNSTHDTGISPDELVQGIVDILKSTMP